MRQALELEAGQHRLAGRGELGRVLGQSLTALLGHALQGRDDGPAAAPVLLREALAQLRVPQHVRPELEEHGEPAVVVAPLEVGDEPLHAGVGRLAGSERPLHLGDPAVHAALVDRQEEVLLRVEVRVHGALRVAGGVGHGVHRGGVEAVPREQTVGCGDQLVARPRLAIRAGERRAHTSSIRIPMVFVKW